MPALARALLDICDPRGRCNRKGLLLIALGLLAVQLATGLVIWLGGVALHGPLVLALKLGFLWLAIAAASKRLHDTGRSAWWILWTLLAVLAWSTVVAIALLLTFGDRILAPGAGGFEIHLALTMLLVLAATLWLHFAAGDPALNRYGTCPSGFGLSGPLPRRPAAAFEMLTEPTAA